MPLTERDYDLLSLYIDDALTPPERRAIESRVASDAEFRAELDALRRTVALVKSLPEMVAPRDLRLTPKMAADVLAELKAAEPVRKIRPTIVYRLTTFAAAAASLVLVFAGALTLLQPGMSQQPMTAATVPTVAVADLLETEATSTETATLKTDEDGTTMGLMMPQGTFEPFATGGFGGAGEQTADTAMMQDAVPTGDAGFYSSAPAPVMTGSEEPPAVMMEEMEAPGSTADEAETMSIPAPTATVASTMAAGSVGRMEVTATQEASASNRAVASTPAGMLLPAPSPAPEERDSQAEMIMLPTMTPEPAAQVIETVVAEAGDDRAAQDNPLDLVERAPITETSSPILGFALVIAGLALGVVALILIVRTG